MLGALATWGRRKRSGAHHACRTLPGLQAPVQQAPAAQRHGGCRAPRPAPAAAGGGPGRIWCARQEAAGRCRFATSVLGPHGKGPLCLAAVLQTLKSTCTIAKYMLQHGCLPHQCLFADLGSRQVEGEPARSLAELVQAEGLSVTTARVDVDYAYWSAHAVLQVCYAAAAADAAAASVHVLRCRVVVQAGRRKADGGLLYELKKVRSQHHNMCPGHRPVPCPCPPPLALCPCCSVCSPRAWRCPAPSRRWATLPT